MNTSWSIESYLDQLTHDLTDLHRGPSDDAMRRGVQIAFDLRRTLTPWLLGKQPLIDTQALDDFSRALLDYCTGLADEYQDDETLGNQITAALGRFVRLLQQCESPLESAFLVGLTAYGDNSIGWASLANSDILAVQAPIESYRIDLVLHDLVSERRWAIELDGHTYHERTEEQAAYDRARDRALTMAGWTVVRFHRRDVEHDIRGCVHELINLCGLPPAPPTSIDPAALKEARTVLHEHQERQAGERRDGAPQHPDRRIATGFRDLDELTSGLHRGDLVIVAGPESEGKTGFALSLALALAQRRANVAVYSGEMTRTQLVTRLLGMLTGIAVSRLHSGTLRDAEMADVAEGMGYLETLPLYIDTPATLTLDALNAGALSLHMNKPIDLLVVDSLHLMLLVAL